MTNSTSAIAAATIGGLSTLVISAFLWVWVAVLVGIVVGAKAGVVIDKKIMKQIGR